MRLLQLEITQCRSDIHGQMPLEGLVVLFGPNSGGKTTVLEAVRELLASDAQLRRDPGDHGGDPWVFGTVWFELPGADLPDSTDAVILRDLLAGKYAAPKSPWRFVDDDDAELLASAPLHEVKQYLVDSLVRQGGAGTPDDRQTLAEALLRNPLFQADPLTVLLVGLRDRLDQAAIEAAERIAAHGPSDDDDLGRVALSLPSGVSWLAAVSYPNGVFADLASVVTLDADPGHLATDVEQAVIAIHNRLWDPIEVRDPMTPLPDWPGVRMSAPRPVQDSPVDLPREAGSGQFVMDSWLEGKVEDSHGQRLVMPNILGRYDEGEWFRVRPTIIATARLIGNHADRLAPSFVKDVSDGDIEVEVLPVGVWSSAESRVRVILREWTGDSRDLEVVGSGTARWVAASVRLACHQLLQAERTVTDSDGQVVTDPHKCNELIESARAEPFTQTSLKLDPVSSVPVVYIVDEPEAHLHPHAVRSVLQWLQDLAGAAATVLVATHNPAFLDTAGTATQLVLVTRKITESGDTINLEHVQGSALQAVTAINDQIGLTPAELFLLTRLVLFVEGEHDAVVLDEWFGEKLASAAIRVVPLRGVDNLVGLPESGLVQALRLPIAVLCDNTDVVAVRDGRAKTRGEQAVREFLRQAQKNSLDIKVVGLLRLDILDYLDPDVCRELAPAFPGWDEARRAAREARYEDWKQWVRDEYQLSLNAETIRRLARDCLAAGRVPEEIVGKIRRILGYAE